MAKKLKAPWLGSYGGRQKSVKWPDGSLYDMVADGAKNWPERTALEYFGRKISYAEFLNQIDGAARGLKALGVAPGDSVAVCSANIPEGVVAIYAASKIGAIANVFHPLSAPNEIKHYLNLAKSKVLVAIDVSWPNIAPIIKETGVKTSVIISPSDSLPRLMKIGFKISAFLPGSKKTPKPAGENVITWAEMLSRGSQITGDVHHKMKTDDVAAVLYSGGTTGSPKGVALSNRSFNAMAVQIREFFPEYVIPGNTILGIMPIFHGFGLGVGVHLMLTNGLGVILLPKFNVKKFDKILAHSRPSFLCGVPTLYEAMLKNKKIAKLDLSFVKLAINGGDALSNNLKQAIDELLARGGSQAKLTEGYGLTECLSAVIITPVEKYKPDTIGIPMANVFAKIVEPNTYIEKKLGEVGEIVLTGPNLMSGYVGDAKETNAALQKHPDGRIWLHTGDLGTMDKDGYIFFRQRLKRMIISSGYNIYPTQIEKVIQQLPEVLMATVVGLPDAYRGQIAKAFVVLKPGAKKAGMEDKIMAHCRENLAKYEWPRQIEFRDSLPKTGIGKVAYGELTK
ncbi:MAG: AMP-binding protein [Candidatus Nomurabacteria bacterium]|jgi:long-chain acyl-CoA synthetase|nr:AMP-binding protein [Candidatus Nomurabacteria bacterium]